MLVHDFLTQVLGAYMEKHGREKYNDHILYGGMTFRELHLFTFVDEKTKALSCLWSYNQTHTVNLV